MPSLAMLAEGGRKGKGGLRPPAGKPASLTPLPSGVKSSLARGRAPLGAGARLARCRAGRAPRERAVAPAGVPTIGGGMTEALATARHREVLFALIETYIESAEPVGSRSLVRSGRFPLSPATIRN